MCNWLLCGLFRLQADRYQEEKEKREAKEKAEAEAAAKKKAAEDLARLVVHVCVSEIDCIDSSCMCIYRIQ